MESKLSDFKMLEEAPYEMPEPRAYTELIVGSLKREEFLFGPVFTARFIKYALQFVAKKYGEEPSEDIRTLDQLKEYLISVSDKYPSACCHAIQYAQVKTESKLEGSSGVAGTRLLSTGVAKSMTDRLVIKERNVDLDAVFIKLRQISIAMKISPQKIGYKKNEDGSVLILHPTCYFLEACQEAFNEGWLKRPDGRIRCSMNGTINQYLKLATGYDWDYVVLEFDKPYCITKCFMV
nr:hypothetical protein [Candidatus Freyarchaeota archaeon]